MKRQVQQLSAFSIFQIVRRPLIYEMVFYQSGHRALAQARVSKYDVTKEERRILMDFEDLDDRMSRELRERLSMSKVRISLWPVVMLEAAKRTRVVPDRMWTSHLEDRINQLIAHLQGKEYVRQWRSIPRKQLVELTKVAKIPPLQEGGIKPGYEQVQLTEEEDCVVAKVVPAPTVKEVSLMGMSVNVHEPQKNQVQVRVEEERTIPGGNFFQVNPTHEMIQIKAYLMAASVKNQWLNDNLVARIAFMLASCPTLEAKNEEIRRIFEVTRLGGQVPVFRGGTQLLSWRQKLLRGDDQAGTIMAPDRLLRDASLHLLGLVNTVGYHVEWDKRYLPQRLQASAMEVHRCLMLYQIPYAGGQPSVPNEICTQILGYYSRDRVGLSNNPQVYSNLSYGVQPRRKISNIDEIKLVMEARFQTWGDTPISVFSFEGNGIKEEIDPSKEWFVAFRGEMPRVLKLNVGLPALMGISVSLSDLPMALVTGPYAALRIGDPVEGILPGWIVFRLPPVGSDRAHSEFQIWVVMAHWAKKWEFSFCPVNIKGASKIPEGRTELMRGSEKGDVLHILAHGWSKKSLYQVRRLDLVELPQWCLLTNRAEVMIVPKEMARFLGRVWISRILEDDIE